MKREAMLKERNEMNYGGKSSRKKCRIKNQYKKEAISNEERTDVKRKK